MWTSKLGEGSYTLIVDSKDEILFNIPNAIYQRRDDGSTWHIAMDGWRPVLSAQQVAWRLSISCRKRRSSELAGFCPDLSRGGHSARAHFTSFKSCSPTHFLGFAIVRCLGMMINGFFIRHIARGGHSARAHFTSFKLCLNTRRPWLACPRRPFR